MPELPEVETMRRGILAVAGSKVAEVHRPRCRLKPIAVRPRLSRFRRRTVGRSIEAVERVGKRVVLRLDSQDRIVFEPRMTGLVLVVDPPDEQHLRFCLELDGPVKRVWFWDRRGLGSVQLFSPSGFEKQLGPTRLGPDALALSPELLQQQLGSSRREIKTALLDQRSIAGIGNLYASEILHLAGIHPQLRCHRVTRGQWVQLYDAITAVLNDAIQYEGSTLSDGTYRNALNEAGGYQNHHRVYDRVGEVCPSCEDAVIRRIVQAQRSTFLCPTCQRKRPKSSRAIKAR